MRRSISGPLIVMTIGALFLVNNFHPDFFTFRSMFRYWPFLLIGLGVIRLIEVFVDAGRARPLAPSRGSSGGFIFLVIACFVFWGISRGARTHWHGFPAWSMDSKTMFGEQYDFDVQQSLPVSAGDTRLLIEGLRGNISISGDDSSSFNLTGRRSIRCFSKVTAGVANNRAKIELVRSGNDIVLRTSRSGVSDDSSISYDIDIKVPRRMKLASQGAVENITAESLDGGIDISGDTGNVRVTSIGGDVRVETTRRKDLVRAIGIKGKLDLRGTGTDLQIEDVEGQVTIQGNYFGTLDFRNLAKPLHFESDQTDLRVEKLPGSISMDLGEFRADNVIGPLRLHCKSRDIHVTDFSNEVDVSLERGDIELNPQRTPLGKIDVHVRAGDIDVTLPEKSSFDLRANTAQGDVDNQFGTAVTATSEGRSAAMKSAAPGGPLVTITTDRGNITVKKS